MVDLQNPIGLYARDLWFDIIEIDLVDFRSRYEIEGYLKCGAPLATTEGMVWRSYYSFAEDDLVGAHGKAMTGARIEST